MRDVSNELMAINLKRGKISSDLSAIRNRIVRIDDEIKKRGQDFVQSGNVLKELKVTQNKFALAKHDLLMIRVCVDNDIFENTIFNDFIQLFKDIFFA